MYTIKVLMSTYNGEHFLEEQLTSIIAQRDVNVDILVRDDGSTDRTTDILDEWQRAGKLKWYSGNNKGFAFSFLDLINNAGNCEYYAFCDQDDIWLPDKLVRGINKLENCIDTLKLYCANAYYYKNGTTFGCIHKEQPYYDKYTCLMRNISPGCTMIFNNNLKEFVVSSTPKEIIAHDFWLFQIAVLLGSVVYDFTPRLLYRQHENNLIGQKKSFKEKAKRRFAELTSSRRNARSNQAKELINCYDEKMTESTRLIVRNVADYRNSLKSKLSLIFDKRYKMGTPTATFFLKIRILFNFL